MWRKKRVRLKMNHKNSDAAYPRYGARKSDKAGVTAAALPLASKRRVGVERDSHPPLGLLKLWGETAEPEEGHPAGQFLRRGHQASSSSQKVSNFQVFPFSHIPLKSTIWDSSLPSLSPAYIQFLLLALSSKLSRICLLLTISVDRLTHTTICSHLDYFNSFLLVILFKFKPNHYLSCQTPEKWLLLQL